MLRAEQRTYTSDVRELRRMSAWWREWAAKRGLPAEFQDRGELCLNEAAGNIIQHAVRPNTIVLTLEQEPASVRMTIADDGQAFDPVGHAVADLPRTLDEARPGGLGLRIVRSATETMAYRRADGWNSLTLILTP